MEYALRHYLNLSARYIAMDDLKHKGINLFERAFGRFDNDHKGLARYTKNYLNDVLGVPSGVEETLNNWVRNSWIGKVIPDLIGDRPAAMGANLLANLTAQLKLGFLNLGSAAINLTQLNGTQAKIGMKYTVRGLTEYLHPTMNTQRLYHEAGIRDNITMENPSGYSRAHNMRGMLTSASMSAFRLFDGMARKTTLLGAYRKARSEGQSHAAAMEYAKQVNDDVNFDYSVADAPDFIRRTGPIGTLAFQFKKFPVKLMELALPGTDKLTSAKKIQYWIPALALSGVFGLPGFDWLKDWIKGLFGKDVELELRGFIGKSSLPAPIKRTILYGALSNLGMNVGRRVGMGDFIPSETEDLLGPTVGTLARVFEALPKIFDDGNFLDTIEALSPGLSNPIKAFYGETRDKRRGRLRFQYQGSYERGLRATGIQPAREAIESDAVRLASYEQAQQSARETAAIDGYIRVMNDKGSPEYRAALDRLRELRINPSRVIQEARKRRQGTAYQRKLLENRRRPERRQTLQEYTGM
jgi:hypothetical protein